MKVLLLSAYDAASHRRWREGLVRHLADIHWTVLTLPPRFFAWRSRGNALAWTFEKREVLDGAFDVLVATSMTDLAALKGLHRGLAALPSLAYFHENQFAYPERRARKEYQNYKLTNLYTALAADRVLFNSSYNRDSFLRGVDGLLSAMPDHVPPGVARSVYDRSEVLPVPLENERFSIPPGRSEGPLQILWNHRWEHDKAPERFFEALFRLRQRGLPFRVHVAGQQFRQHPDVFTRAREMLGDDVLTWGYVADETRYRAILSSADVVVSTALHDFQGLAVLEAAAAGCLPVVPDRLAYPEFFPGQFRYPSFEEDPAKEVEGLAGRLAELCADTAAARSLGRLDLGHLSWESLGPRYGEVIKAVSGGPADRTRVTA